VATNRLNRPLLNIRLHFSAKDLARLKFSQQPQNKKAVDSGRNLISKTYHFIVYVFTHSFNSPSKFSVLTPVKDFSTLNTLRLNLSYTVLVLFGIIHI